MFINGAIHWAIRPPNYRKSIFIVSLDIKTETCQQIELPKYGEDVYSLTLGTFGKKSFRF